MIRTIAPLAIFFFVGCLSVKERTPAAEDASKEIRLAITYSARINVYEGLPHQMFERELLAKESKRKDTKKIGSYLFYIPAVVAANPELLKRILSSPDTIQIFRGEKLCGGFHPDYTVEWFEADGSRFIAQICFGCHEIIYSDGEKEYRYDFEDEPFEELKKELTPFEKKRPKNTTSRRLPTRYRSGVEAGG